MNKEIGQSLFIIKLWYTRSITLGKFKYKYVYYLYNMYIMYTYICMDVWMQLYMSLYLNIGEYAYGHSVIFAIQSDFAL